jgi:hypothetical protein
MARSLRPSRRFGTTTPVRASHQRATLAIAVAAAASLLGSCAAGAVASQTATTPTSSSTIAASTGLAAIPDSTEEPLTHGHLLTVNFADRAVSHLLAGRVVARNTAGAVKKQAYRVLTGNPGLA